MAQKSITLGEELYNMASHVASMIKAPDVEVAVGFSLALTQELMYRLQAEQGSSLLIRAPDGTATELAIQFDWPTTSTDEGTHGYH